MKIGKVFYFLKEFYGGATTFAKILAKMSNSDIKSFAVSFEKPDNFTNKIIYLTNNHPTSFFPSLRKLILLIRNIFLSSTFINKERPEIIMCGDNYSFILLNLTKAFLHVKPILILRVGAFLPVINEKPFFFYRQLLLLLVNYFVGRTDYFICQTKGGLLDFINVFKPKKNAKLVSIYNGIDLKKATILGSKKMNLDESQLFKNDASKIISVGRFDGQKDFFTLIRAFKAVHDNISTTRLFLVGDGTLRNEIIKLIDTLKIRNSVFLLGWKENVFPYLKRADLFVHSSFYEGFPFSVLEAMSQKLPIISTDTPFGPSEILKQNKYGILVPIGNHNEMAKKIIILLRDNILRKKYSELSYKRVEFFSEERMIKKYKDFFKSLMH